LFEGQSLLEYLETVSITRSLTSLPFRFPVQIVARPNDEFRGYAGQIASGIVRVGDRVVAWPSGGTARVSRIVTYDGDLDLAFAPMSVTLTLDDEIDVSRGDLLAIEHPPHTGSRFEAEVVWMDERPLDPARVYLLKHTTRTVTAEVSHGLVLNQIGTVAVSTSRPLVFDRYGDNRTTGSFILIDPSSCFTAGAGLMTRAIRESGSRDAHAQVSAPERLALLARTAGSDAEAIDAVARALEELRPVERAEAGVRDPCSGEGTLKRELSFALLPSHCCVRVQVLVRLKPDTTYTHEPRRTTYESRRT